MRSPVKRWLIWLMMGGCLLQIQPANCVPTTDELEATVNSSIGNVIGGTIDLLVTTVADAIIAGIFPGTTTDTGT